MKLERITLENFRQYYGQQRVEFSRSADRPVTVIHGANGAGKTSLLLAINWCLYGRSVENVKVIENVGELMSKEAVRRAEPGETVCAAVQLTFLYEGERYLARRTLQGMKHQDGTVLLDNAEEFTMMRTRGDGQSVPVANPIGTMNAILPVNVRDYFLFDGERIDSFTRPEASRQVKEAVYLVLKLEILKRARAHLEEVAADCRLELKRKSVGELRGLIEGEEKARKERARCEERKTALEESRRSAQQKIAEIEQRLREMENTRGIQEQRQRTERDLRARRTEMDALVVRIRDGASSAYGAIAAPAIQRALQVLELKRERGEIPSNIRHRFVQDLLEQMRCICGREFAEHSPEHERLLGLLEHSVPGSLEDDVLDTSAALHTFSERFEAQCADLDAAMRRRAELVDEIGALDAELDDLGRQLRGSPLEEISALEKQRQSFAADLESYIMDAGRLNERAEALSRQIAELQDAIAKAQKEERREQVISTKLNLAQQAADAIGEVHEAFAEDMRARIEAKTREIFRLLVWKESHFQDVRLDKEFDLQVIDRYGLPARPELSAGERQVLSLAFITAMSRVSGEEAPLVMDTPFGRLSSEHRNSISQHLPGLADQLVLLVTDEELRDQARRNLEPRIGAEYRLEFNTHTSCTEIVEVAP